MVIEYYPTFTATGGKDWRIADYKKRIYNKVNRVKYYNGDCSFIKIEEVNNLVLLTMEKFKIKTEMEALIFINRELTKKQMERYQNARQVE